jgi:uncharacterized protein (DUF2141 family)
MMTNRVTRLALLSAIALLIAPGTGLASDAGAGSLAVSVSGFKNAQGHAIINLFREGQDVLKLRQAYRRASSAIEGGHATFSFGELPFGNYAISVFHDVNDNGELDHKMGLPAEPLAFSNGFHLSLFSGLPSFQKLKFPFSGNTGVIEIRFK